MYRLIFPFILLACESEKAIQAYNSNPEATITSHSDGALLPTGTEIVFAARVSDANHGAEELTVLWKSDARTLCEEETVDPSGEVLCTVVLEEDDSTIIVQVTDPEGASGIDSLDLTLETNSPPIVEITSPVATGSYYSQDLILFSAVVSDDQDSPEDLTLSWSSSIDGVLGQANSPDSSGTVENFFTLSEGEHSVSIEVTDQNGATTTRSTSIIVQGENEAPTCGITSPSSGDAFVEGQSIIFVASTSDQETSPNDLVLSWVSDKDGALGSGLINSSGEVTFSLSNLSANTHTIQFNVEDEGGEICSDTILISVGNPPELALLTPTTGSLFTFGETISFSGTVQDSQDLASSIDISWESDIDGVFSTQGSSSNGEILLNTGGLSAGAHNITVTATDSTGLTDVEALIVRVNQVPTQPTVSITPDPATASQNLVVSVSGSIDADGDSISYVYEWFQNGTTTSQTSTTINSGLTNAGDTWMVRVTPNDGYHDGPPAEASIVISESIPQFDSSAQITPSNNITPSTLLTCSASAYDPDGGTISYAYSWTNLSQSTSLGSGSTLQLSSSIAQAGDNIQCMVTATDSASEQNTSTDDVIIDNNPPVISSLQLSPSPLYTDDTPTVSISASDPDGQAINISYSWSVDGQVVQTGTQTTLASSFFSKDQVVLVEATVDDGSASTVQSTNITCENTPPEVPGISLTPVAPLEGVDDLVCSLTTASSDIDGDSITYDFSWTVNGSPFTNASNSASSSVISQYDTASGDEWICTITPNDGDNDGAAVSATVNVTSDWDGALMFTNCGQTGPTGPSQVQCDGEYAGTGLDGDVSVSAGFQTWVVPNTGTYTIEVAGAQGGYSTGANGATMYGEFSLVAGDSLTIAVGQSGANGSGSGGGGGGTFVALNTTDPLIIAGGGGGGHGGNVSTPIGGQTTEQGLSNPSTGSGYSGASGGGWFSDGANGDTGATGGKSWANGLIGGANTTQSAWSTSPGGFGGGGGPCWSPGGGGGYYGGVTPPSYGNGTPGGSGGGSYNSGSNQNNTSSSNAGHGYVIIDVP